MGSFFKSIFLFVVVIVFVACDSNDEAKVIVDNSKSFSELKKESNKNFVLKTVENKELKLKIENDILSSKSLNGKTVLINFWATWCPPCLKEIPIFNKLYEKYNNKFEIVAVLYKDSISKEDLNTFIEKYNIKFPIIVGEENLRLAKLLDNVQKVPESFLYGKDGKYIRKYVGEVDQFDIEKILSKQ